MFIAVSADNRGVEEPPGITALSVLPSLSPPANSNNLEKGVPIGTSKLEGFWTLPVTEKHFVPPEFSTPKSANHFPPLVRISGTLANVSVLLIVVGFPNSPTLAGKGGLNLG